MKYFNLWNFKRVGSTLPLSMTDNDELAGIWFIENILDLIREEYMDNFYIQNGYKYENEVFTIELTTRKGNYKNRKLYDIIKKMQKEGKITFKEMVNVYGCSWIVLSSYVLDNYHKNRNLISKIG